MSLSAKENITGCVSLYQDLSSARCRINVREYRRGNQKRTIQRIQQQKKASLLYCGTTNACHLYNNVVLAMTMPKQQSGLKTQCTTRRGLHYVFNPDHYMAQSLLTQHYYYYDADCYMQTKYIENYYSKGGTDIGD